MKILIAASSPHPHIGGKSTHVLTLADGLRELGHEMEIVSEADLGTASRLLIRGSGFLVKRLLGPWGRNTATLWQYRLKRRMLTTAIYRRLKSGQFDVVSCQDVMAQNIITSCARRQPSVLTVHGDQTNELVSAGALRRGSRAETWFIGEEKLGYCSADRIIAVDSRLRTHILEMTNGAVSPDRVCMLYNFVNVEQFRPAHRNRPEDRRRWDLGADDLVILCPRRLTAKNGVNYAVEAMVHTAERLGQQRSFVLLLAGDGPERRSIERLVSRASLQRSVRLLGDVPHAAMPALYRAADLTVIPSVSSAGVVEATSIAALESMASGVPVIASAIGGLTEIIGDERTGLLVPERNSLAIAEAILLLADDPQLREAIAGRARRFVVEHHSHLAAAGAFVDLCNDTDGQAPRCASSI